MSTLQQKSFTFNPKLHISNDGGYLTSNAGMVLVQEFLHKINFDHLLEETVRFTETRKYWKHSMTSLAKQLLFQLIAGYQADSAANRLATDPAFTLILGKERLVSQPTLSRFITSLTPEALAGLHELVEKLNDLYLRDSNQQTIIVGIDSTHSDTFGKQEHTHYNGHYATTGYHPLVAFDGLSGLCLDAELRPGNVYTSRDSEAFLRPIIQRYRNYSCNMIVLVRGDSGFAKPEIYDLCEELQAQFLIRLKANTKLQAIAEALITYGDDTRFSQQETLWFELND